MKNRHIVWIILTITAFCIIGCSSGPKIKNVTYDFSENENTNGTALIYIHNAHSSTEGHLTDASYTTLYEIIDFEGMELPESAEGTRWEPIIVPAGRELNIRIRFNFRGKYGSSHSRRGIFKCPPLEAGKKYKLWFEPSGNGSYDRDRQNGGGRLILTDAKVKELKYVFGIKSSPVYNQTHIQEIPPLW